MKRRVIKTICGAVIVGAAPAAWADTPCQWCGGADWIKNCTTARNDVISDSEADVGIYMNSACSGIPASFRMLGPVTIRRESSGGSDTIVTEIVSMNLTGGGLTLLAGTGAGLTRASPGTIVKQAGNNLWGNSSFSVYFKVIGVFGTVWNHDPLLVAAAITCVPPKAEYIHPQGQCIPLYNDPVTGTIVAYLGNANHITYPSGVPALPAWGGIALAALLFVAGIFVFGNRRREPAT